MAQLQSVSILISHTCSVLSIEKQVLKMHKLLNISSCHRYEQGGGKLRLKITKKITNDFPKLNPTSNLNSY